MVTAHSAGFMVNTLTGDSTIGRRIWHLSMKTKVSTVSWYAYSLLAHYQGTQTWAIMNSTTDFNSLWGLTLHDIGDEVYPRVKLHHCHSV